jgi:preprotein translocase subunit SecF
MDAPKSPKFFEVIPPGTKFPFVKNRWRFIWGSILMVLLSAAALAYNQFTKGSMLNFGIDFAGGSSVRLELGKDVPIDDIRTALEELGYEGSQAVTVPDAANEVLIRVKDVVTIDGQTLEKCEAAARAATKAQLIGFQHPEGGSKVFLKFDSEPDYPAVSRALNEAGCVGTLDKGFEVREGEIPVELSLVGIGNRIAEQFDERFGAGTVEQIVHAETVGAKVGNQLKADGAKSLLYALGFIFLYVMLRFDLRFAPGGIVALIHDAFITVGAFAITWREFNLTTIAAILTIVGYSINDTIVVFDRVRERVALFRDEDIEETSNRALNETLSRTILTSGTTLLSVIATYAMGTGAIADFAFALIVGITVGTYSSIFIATPVFLWVNRRFYGGTGHLRWRASEGGGEGPAVDPDRPVLAASAGEVDETGHTAAELREKERAAAGLEPGADEAERPEIPPPEDGAPTDDGPLPKASRRRRRRPQ